MKGYCKCGKVIDEVTFTQFGMCVACVKEILQEAKLKKPIYKKWQVM